MNFRDNDYHFNYGNGITGLDALQIALIVLKLLDKISWSWWIVLLPFIVTFGVAIIAALFAIIIKHSENRNHKHY